MILGVIATPDGDPADLVAAARRAEERGLPELWLWEDCFLVGGIASAASILGATQRIRVGIGVLPFPLRNVALAAMEVATLTRMHPGRFLPGFGHGVQEWMAQAGVRPRSVLTLEREYVTALRSLLAGEEVSVDGEYVRLDRVRLGWPPASPPALHLAAGGPRSLEASGRLGDGTVIDATASLDELPAMLELVARGRAESGRPGEHEISYFTALDRDDPDAVLRTIERAAAIGVHRVLVKPDARDAGRTLELVETLAERILPRLA